MAASISLWINSSHLFYCNISSEFHFQWYRRMKFLFKLSTLRCHFKCKEHIDFIFAWFSKFFHFLFFWEKKWSSKLLFLNLKFYSNALKWFLKEKLLKSRAAQRISKSNWASFIESNYASQEPGTSMYVTDVKEVTLHAWDHSN